MDGSLDECCMDLGCSKILDGVSMFWVEGVGPCWVHCALVLDVFFIRFADQERPGRLQVFHSKTVSRQMFYGTRQGRLWEPAGRLWN